MMIMAMLLAHLTADYVLQWDALARQKGASVKGAAGHGLIVLAVTLLFAVLIDPAWWPWALLIGLAHIVIDASWVGLNHRFAPRSGRYWLVRLLIDQTLHFAVILGALCASGYAAPTTLFSTAVSEAQSHRAWVIALSYVIISMPAWIFIEFLIYGLIRTSGPVRADCS